MKPKSSRHITLAVGAPAQVDPESGRLTNLSLMTGGREAKGHGVYIDDLSLSTALEVAQAKGPHLKGYRTHDHGGPGSGMWWAPEGSELDVCGYFSELAIKGDQFTAAGFDFYDSYKTAEPLEYARILEMAAKTPDLLALSIECWGYAVYVAEDGTEYSERPEDTPLKYEGMPALRVTDLFAAAFVSDGAANDGLFARLGSKGSGKIGEILTSLAVALGVTDPAAVATRRLNNASSSSEKKTMKIIDQIKARFGADPAKFTRAMTILGNDSKLSFEAVESQVEEETSQSLEDQVTSLTEQLATVTAERDTAVSERDALQEQVTTLTEQLATANAELEELNGTAAENTDLKVKLAAAKGSGYGGVHLHSATPPAGTEVNPFATASINLDEQARLLKTDPVRAEALKVLAGLPKK